jgi:hypothetical protein
MAEVYNEPQEDGTVIQYNHSGGHEIARFPSDEACQAAMAGDEHGAILRPLTEGQENAVDKLFHRVFGEEKPHAA